MKRSVLGSTKSATLITRKNDEYLLECWYLNERFEVLKHTGLYVKLPQRFELLQKARAVSF